MVEHPEGGEHPSRFMLARQLPTQLASSPAKGVKVIIVIIHRRYVVGWVEAPPDHTHPAHVWTKGELGVVPAVPHLARAADRAPPGLVAAEVLRLRQRHR